MSFKKLLIYCALIYLVLLFIAWFMQDSQLDAELAQKLEKEYVMHKGLNNTPEFYFMGINAQHESVIPAYGKARYYQGWSEYYAYLHGALESMIFQVRDDVLADEKLMSDVQSILKSWGQIYNVEPSSQPTQEQQKIQISFSEQLEQLMVSHEPRLKQLLQRQTIYRHTLTQQPQILFGFASEKQTAQTLKVLHLMTLHEIAHAFVSQQAKLNQLQQYLNDLQRWYAKCSSEEMCLFFLNAASDTLDMMVLDVKRDALLDQIKIQEMPLLRPVLERLYLEETASLRVMLHIVGSYEIYEKGDDFAQENPDKLDPNSRILLKWVVQPLMRIFVLHNDSANFYWYKHETMLDLAELPPERIVAKGPIKFDVSKKFYTPKNLFGKMTAWVSSDMEYQVVAHHKLLQKMQLINLWQSNAYQLDLERWNNKPAYVYKNENNEICRENPIFEYFIAYEVQVRPQCIGEVGMINKENNLFNDLH